LIVPAFDGPAKFRRKLSFVGAVFVSLVLDDKGGIVSVPRIVADGAPAHDGEEVPFDEIIAATVETALHSIPRPRRRNDEAVRETVRNAVRRSAEEVWGKRPVCHVMVHRL
jgi:ribonuclease J